MWVSSVSSDTDLCNPEKTIEIELVLRDVIRGNFDDHNFDDDNNLFIFDTGHMPPCIRAWTLSIYSIYSAYTIDV